MNKALLVLLAVALFLPGCGEQQEPDPPSAGFRVRLQVELGRDHGQHLGTLFEATDAGGRVVAGAGFQESSNTCLQSDRRLLQFYLRPLNRQPQFERLPRVNEDAGVYIFSLAGRILARSGSDGDDRRLWAWDDDAKRWIIEERRILWRSISVESGLLATTSTRIIFNGDTVLALEEGFLDQAFFHANGFLVIRHEDASGHPPFNRLIACPWRPGQGRLILSNGTALTLRSPDEFVYAFGRLGHDILATTNTGGVYRFDGRSWSVLREPDPAVSFQIYSVIQFGDRLLLGHYPLGVLYEYDGAQLRRLPGWPPVMSGVFPFDREAQTLAFYAGDLYLGVWPWAELWRYDRETWSMVRRLFSHPEPTAAVTHPYEREALAAGEVEANRWGQRITSLVPHGDALFLSTSAKGARPHEGDLEFLSGDRRKDYGAVYRLRLPGNLAVLIDWKNGPTTFEFVLAEGYMKVFQDGVLIGIAAVDASLISEISARQVTFGKGLYGPTGCALLDTSFQSL